MSSSRRALLTGVSTLYIIAGSLGLCAGLVGSFRSGRLFGTGHAAWGIVLLALMMFEGVLMVSAGIIGLHRAVRTGALCLGVLVLAAGAVWLALAWVGAPALFWIPLLVVVSSVFYLLGVRRAYPPDNAGA